MNAFSYPSKRGINFAKIRGFKVTDYNVRQPQAGYKEELDGQASGLGPLFFAGLAPLFPPLPQNISNLHALLVALLQQAKHVTY